jgi:hypothetical protein
MFRLSFRLMAGSNFTFRWNDPDIAFPWPFKDADIIKSDKDGRLPRLKELESPFPYDGHSLAALTVSNLG